MTKIFSFFLVVVMLSTACSKKTEFKHLIKGKITVADSVDPSKDYSGIGYLVFRRDSTQKADTLFFAQTDSLGIFSGLVKTELKGIYPVYITRNNKILAYSSLILTQSDTIQIQAELPGYNQTEKILSKEYEAKDVFNRLNKNFERIAKYVNSGRVTPDTIPAILTSWSDFYWSVHRKYPETIAANDAISECFRLLSGSNDEKLLQRYDSLKIYPNLRVAFARVAADAIARTKGLEVAVNFLRDRQKEAPTPAQSLQVIRNEIELLADSNQYTRANELIKKHQNLFNTIKGAKSWATYFNKETGRLAPGKPLPHFKVKSEKDSVSNETFAGKVFVLEVAGLSSELYLSEFGELNSLYPIYSIKGVDWFTIPLDPQAAIDAFRDEQLPNWRLADAHNFDTYPLMDSLNVIQIPTRFLIDKKGNIIRKYKPNEINRLLNDILKAVRVEESDNS